jgi:hypothetical protein
MELRLFVELDYQAIYDSANHHVSIYSQKLYYLRVHSPPKGRLLAFWRLTVEISFLVPSQIFLSPFYLNASSLNDENYGGSLVYAIAYDMNYVYISLEQISVDPNGIF